MNSCTEPYYGTEERKECRAVKSHYYIFRILTFTLTLTPGPQRDWDFTLTLTPGPQRDWDFTLTLTPGPQRDWDFTLTLTPGPQRDWDFTLTLTPGPQRDWDFTLTLTPGPQRDWFQTIPHQWNSSTLPRPSSRRAGRLTDTSFLQGGWDKEVFLCTKTVSRAGGYS